MSSVSSVLGSCWFWFSSVPFSRVYGVGSRGYANHTELPYGFDYNHGPCDSFISRLPGYVLYVFTGIEALDSKIIKQVLDKDWVVPVRNVRDRYGYHVQIVHNDDYSKTLVENLGVVYVDGSHHIFLSDLFVDLMSTTKYNPQELTIVLRYWDKEPSSDSSACSSDHGDDGNGNVGK